MLLAYGFLRRIFEVFELYKTPIDMITTAEVSVSVTIDDPTHLEAIIKKLAAFSIVEVEQNQSIICVVGDFVAASKGVALQVIQQLKDIPLRMISYGGSRHNISILIKETHKIAALNALHNGLFKQELLPEQEMIEVN